MFNFGDKVVPIKKLAGHDKLEGSHHWTRAKEKGQGYLYVIRKEPRIYSCAVDENNSTGDHFYPEDLIPYEDLQDWNVTYEENNLSVFDWIERHTHQCLNVNLVKYTKKHIDENGGYPYSVCTFGEDINKIKVILPELKGEAFFHNDFEHEMKSHSLDDALNYIEMIKTYYDDTRKFEKRIEGEKTKLKHRVYDERTDETLFESKDNKECVDFMDANYGEEHQDFAHIWMETFEVKNCECGNCGKAFEATQPFLILCDECFEKQDVEL